jgi:hypothetical protein
MRVGGKGINPMVPAVGDVMKALVFRLVVVVIGAAITGWALPGLARRRDVRQKALEVRTQLVSDMSRIVIAFVTAVRFAIEDGKTEDGDYQKRYREWEDERAVLGTKLEAYFPNTNIPNNWRDFVAAMSELYDITRGETART